MIQNALKRCLAGCCRFINDEPVSEQEYEGALRRHPGNYPGIGQGKRNAVAETCIACRKPPESGTQV
jgi:hypothetical protein